MTRSRGVGRGSHFRSYNFRHGHAARSGRSPEYRSWVSMMSRCYNPRTVGYMYWGGRGIRVCEAWHSFEHFFADVGHKPTPRYTLDRIDNNGHYEPGNVRWATPSEQQRNRRDSVRVIVDGVSRSVKEWAAATGVNHWTIYRRLREGWEPSAAVCTRPKEKTA